MTFSDDSLCGRSQDLTCAESNNKIVIDRNTFEQLVAFVEGSAEELVKPRDCEIFLTCLDIYLSQTGNPDPRKSLLLLNLYREVIPNALLEIAGWLEEAREIINVILAASKLERLDNTLDTTGSTSRPDSNFSP